MATPKHWNRERMLQLMESVVKHARECTPSERLVVIEYDMVYAMAEVLRMVNRPKRMKLKVQLPRPENKELSDELLKEVIETHQRQVQ